MWSLLADKSFETYIGVAQGISLVMSILVIGAIRYFAKIPVARILYLIGLGCIVFFVIRFLQGFIGITKDFDLFFVKVSVTGNDFITNLQEKINLGIHAVDNLKTVEQGGLGSMWQEVKRTVVGMGTYGSAALLLAVVLEEILKICMFYYYRKTTGRATSVASAFFYAICVALGFAMIENFWYIQNEYENVMRSIGSIVTPESSVELITNVKRELYLRVVSYAPKRTFAGLTSHMFFTGVFALILARGFFGGLFMADNESNRAIKKKFWILKMFGVRKKETIERAYLVQMFVFGMLASTFAHLTYNTLHYLAGIYQNIRFMQSAILFACLGIGVVISIVVFENKNRFHYSVIIKKIELAKKLKEVEEYYGEE